ncbi:hypothetical protein N474_11480 [Pseudoalteromonas luteoviolacea CPMOR-2]|uniref:hypothetical protein n=1 Tax=Pseudoalteromonas luteoviolacea TaxID=43657 RepID=UPI0007B090CE|nr:hypothetical protein [Pseudoalteromonas luteoviolacea]KZN56359.1 hypothetical protein N474_11480 [Pseudoalteromonas luteoviolacea CPMOR-2]
MFNSPIKTLSLAVLCSAILSGCGGKGGSNSPSIELDSNKKVTTEENKYARRGRVIDGYVQGATVWIDLNNNKTKDTNEPSVISTDKGSYILELTEEQAKCASYVPTYVDVPVGAIDEDLGEVTKAYQMVLPPTLESLDDEALQHITPLTTVLWQSLAETPEFKNATCAELVKSNSVREELLIVLEQTTKQVVEHYNISEEQLFSDYIESGDEALQKLAESIVKGLQASVEKYLELAKKYVDAPEIRVIHYKDTPPNNPESDDLVWYRKIHISDKHGGTLLDETALMDDSLKNVLYIHYNRQSRAIELSGGHSYRQIVDVVLDHPEDTGHCFHSEQLKLTINGIEYEISNEKMVERDSQEQVCDFSVDFSDAKGRSLTLSYNKGAVHYFAQFAQDNHLDTKQGLTDWYNLGDNFDLLDVIAIVSYFDNAGYELDAEVTIPFSWWEKRVTDDSGEYRVTTSRRHDGSWTRKTYKADGTYDLTCSTDGENWTSECN